MSLIKALHDTLLLASLALINASMDSVADPAGFLAHSYMPVQD